MYLDGKYFPPNYAMPLSEQSFSPQHTLDATISELSRSVFFKNHTDLRQRTCLSHSFTVHLPDSPFQGITFLAESPSSEISRSLTQTPITPVCLEEHPPSDPLKTVFEAIEKWINRKDLIPDQVECEKYLGGMFTTFNKSQDMLKFFSLFCEANLIGSFLEDKKSWPLLKISYGGKIARGDLDAVSFKKINIVLFFLKYFQSNPKLIINELNLGRHWTKQLLTFIWASPIGKIGVNLLFKTLQATVNA